MDLELLGRAAATYGVAARSPGCCAQRLGRAQASSLSVDVVQRQRHAAILFFANGRPAMELEDGPRAAGASGRGGDLRGRGAIAGLLRTAVGSLIVLAARL
jgi:hypothetical protein